MGHRPPRKAAGALVQLPQGAGLGHHLAGEKRTWLNPMEMRQSLEPIQSSRESLLFSCPRTLCKAQETQPWVSLLGTPRGTRVLLVVAMNCPGAEHTDPGTGSQLY